MKFEKKGILAPFTIITSFLTGAIFPLLGALIALDLKAITTIYYHGLFLSMIGGFIAHWVLAHSIHDYFHKNIENRSTFSKNTLKIIMITSGLLLFLIALYLSIVSGWVVMVFAILGAVLCMYAKGLFHHESQMAFGAFFLVLGGFYVQVGTLNLPYIVWMKTLFIALFALLSQLGWLYLYRQDDYNWDRNYKNRSILVTKSGLLFIILYFLL